LSNRDQSTKTLSCDILEIGHRTVPVSSRVKWQSDVQPFDCRAIYQKVL
jgi:hypothetical protein